jgi:prepilin-type N-terminal cleavage/methylation domain-containing protein
MELVLSARNRPTKKGFSLVELSIVIAIIGILAMMAVPQLEKWIYRTKRLEAKNNLSNLYECEQALKNQFGIYTNRFSCMGFDPQGRLRYRICTGSAGGDIAGIPELSSCAGAGAPMDSWCTTTYCPAANCQEASEATNTSSPWVSGLVNNVTFQGTAYSDLTNTGGCSLAVDTCDLLLIRETKNLSLVYDVLRFY